MKVAIITMWYNESFLAPLFFQHYNPYIDEIHVILDADSTDETESICSYFNAHVHKYKFPAGMNDILKIQEYNKLKAELNTDFIIGLDADEFIFEPQKIKDHLAFSEFEYAIVQFYQIYQHITEKSLNKIDPIFEQRTHGDPNLSGWNAFYVKPCIVKSKLNIFWDPGCHTFSNKSSLSNINPLKGAHWHMADVEIAIKRRLAIKQRQSQFNLDNHFTNHNHHITEAKIRSVCELHENDPRIF